MFFIVSVLVLCIYILVVSLGNVGTPQYDLYRRYYVSFIFCFTGPGRGTGVEREYQLISFRVTKSYGVVHRMTNCRTRRNSNARYCVDVNIISYNSCILNLICIKMNISEYYENKTNIIPSKLICLLKTYTEFQHFDSSVLSVRFKYNYTVYQ